MSMKKILVDYVGTVRGLRSHLAAQMYPGKVVSLEQYKKEKPPRQRRSGGFNPRPSVRGNNRCVVNFSIPETVA